MGKYAGLEWLKANRSVKEISPLGERVAELLGEWAAGLYHLSDIEKVDWANPYFIEVSLGYKNMATWDAADLTHLVFLAHWLCIRIEVTPKNRNTLSLLFHGREREGQIYKRHPRLDEAVERFKRGCSLAEFVSVTVEATVV